MRNSYKANSAFHPSGGSKWVPASSGKVKADMVHSISKWTLWDSSRTCAIPERLRGVFTTRLYTNPRLPLPYLTMYNSCCFRLLNSLYIQTWISVAFVWAQCFVYLLIISNNNKIRSNNNNYDNSHIRRALYVKLQRHCVVRIFVIFCWLTSTKLCMKLL